MFETKAPLIQPPSRPAPISPDHAVIVSNNIPLTTHTGFEFHVRPVEPSDKEARAEFFTHVSPEDLRLCFLSSIPEVRAPLLDDLVKVDHDHKEDYLAFDIDDKTIVASAMVEDYDDKSYLEVSIAVRSDYKHRGMSWTLLNHVIEQAWQSGIKNFCR